MGSMFVVFAAIPVDRAGSCAPRAYLAGVLFLPRPRDHGLAAGRFAVGARDLLRSAGGAARVEFFIVAVISWRVDAERRRPPRRG
jgi:hypothetical protein